MSKRDIAAEIYAEYTNSESKNNQNLNDLLDVILKNPLNSIDDCKTIIDWCNWLIAGGRTPDEFIRIVKEYNNSTKCGLVWTPNFIAYRCRTCAISPCMSLCTDCFKNGHHNNHDFNMFLSQAGGACDCGDKSVIKETGFCHHHGQSNTCNNSNNKKIPKYLMSIAEAIMPRIIKHLIQHLRDNYKINDTVNNNLTIINADLYLQMLLDFNYMGGLMRQVMILTLTNQKKYNDLMNNNNKPSTDDYFNPYYTAIESLPNPEPPEQYKNCPSLKKNLIHSTFLDEIMFWTVAYEFPQKIVCLLLNMLPDNDYKESLIRSFVLHYSRISMMLEKSNDPNTLSNRVVHVSVQLFSNKSLALRMVDELKLLHVMVISIKYMISKILIKNKSLHKLTSNINSHFVADCNQHIMKDHCYWPIVSDLNNVLSHEAVGVKFLSDDLLINLWFDFLSMFQGMNVNIREMNEHVVHESLTYYAAFSAELEASAYPMWALVSHLQHPDKSNISKKLISICLTALKKWLDNIGFTSADFYDVYSVSFHIPLHRYLSVFICHVVKQNKLTLDELLPSNEILHLLMMHPLRIQVAFHEILNGLWTRNGTQLRGQAIAYIQYDFCYSMIDSDIYLLQLCATKLNSYLFLNTIIDKFHIKEWLNLKTIKKNSFLDDEHCLSMIESFLIFLSIIVCCRKNIGLNDNEISEMEMITLLCIGDKTHSKLIELMPGKCGTTINKNFEKILGDIGEFYTPNLDPIGGALPQGIYTPKYHVWIKLYDPLHVLLRAIYRKDYQLSMDRFTQTVKKMTINNNNLKTYWPPFRLPTKVSSNYQDPRIVLRTKIFHSLIFSIFYKAVYGNNVTEHVLALAVYLLEMAVVTADDKISEDDDDDGGESEDFDVTKFYKGDGLVKNLKTIVPILNVDSIPEGERKIEDEGNYDHKNENGVTESSSFSSSYPAKEEDFCGENDKKSGDSIISLLLKLHSQLSGTPGSFNPNEINNKSCTDNNLPNSNVDDESRIGDGPFFINKLLCKIGNLHEILKENIIKTKNNLWPIKKVDENKIKEDERDERRKRAKERQKKLMSDIVNQQNEFIKKMEKNNSDINWNLTDDKNIEFGNKKTYHCVICNQTETSTDDKPMGFVVLLQSTNILGYERKNKERINLPVNDDDDNNNKIQRIDTRGGYFNNQIKKINSHFDVYPWLTGVNISWEHGAYVQTCGHHLHIECLKSYRATLCNQKNLAVDRGEYLCPLCRQLANFVLPISPKIGEDITIIKSHNSSSIKILDELNNYFKQIQRNSETTNLTISMNKTIERIFSSIYLRHSQKNFQPNRQCLYYILTSILKLNFEIEIIQRGGKLKTEIIESSVVNDKSKSDFIVALLHVLSMFARILKNWQNDTTWQQLNGQPILENFSSPEYKVPILFRDPTMLLIEYCLLLPPHIDKNYFSTVVKVIYNLLYYQVLIQALTRAECKKIGKDDDDSSSKIIRNVIDHLDKSDFYKNLPVYYYHSGQSIDQKIQKLCLPFLRIAALLCHHIYSQPLPQINDKKTEFSSLVYYLELVTEGIKPDFLNAAIPLNWQDEKSSINIPRLWCCQLLSFNEHQKIGSKKLIIDQHVYWESPKLLNLPIEYEKLFTYYHKKKCLKCNKVPDDVSICLICGTIVCLKQNCCKHNNVGEAVQHSIDCGGSTGIFLAVKSTYIVVIRGRRACLWGSLYLDDFKEEDKDLKRGKPLYLSKDRYQLLEQQWIGHRFDHTKKSWLWHGNSL